MATGKKLAVPGDEVVQDPQVEDGPETDEVPTDRMAMQDQLIAELMDRQELMQQQLDRLEARQVGTVAQRMAPPAELPTQAEALQLSKETGKAVLSRDGYVTAR